MAGPFGGGWKNPAQLSPANVAIVLAITQAKPNEVSVASRIHRRTRVSLGFRSAIEPLPSAWPKLLTPWSMAVVIRNSVPNQHD